MSSDQNEETKNEVQFESYKRSTWQGDTLLVQKPIFNDSDENTSIDLEYINEEQNCNIEMYDYKENSVDFLADQNEKSKRDLDMQPDFQV